MSTSWGPTRHDTKSGCGWFAYSVVALVGVLIVAFIVTWASWGISVATAGIVGQGNAHKQINSADFRITAYDHFFNLCASVQTAEDNLDAQFDLLAVTTESGEKHIVNVNIAGLKSARASGINQYNADASKDWTVGQFRDASLPFQLPSGSYDKKGPHTTCAL